jgi:hypothetical protein
MELPVGHPDIADVGVLSDGSQFSNMLDINKVVCLGKKHQEYVLTHMVSHNLGTVGGLSIRPALETIIPLYQSFTVKPQCRCHSGRGSSSTSLP